MSILAANESGPPLWAWVVWLVVALGVATVLLLKRPKPHAEAGREAIGLLAFTGLASFVGWFATQLIYVTVKRQAGVTSDTADLVRLSVLSAFVGWAVGVVLIARGRGGPLVGMGVRRLPGGVVQGVVGIFVALPVVYFALAATLAIWSAMHIEHPAKHELLEALDKDPRRWVKLTAVLSAAIVAPLFEEFLFRGCVQNGLRRATGLPSVAIIVASLLFAIIHPMWTIPPIFVFSVLLGIVYERTRNLWAVTIMHALFNIFSLVNSGLN